MALPTIHATYRTRQGLTDAAIELLGIGHYTIMGTENPDGSVHMVPVMYLFDGGHVFAETSAATRKARNVIARPRATVLVQDHRAEGTAWVSGAGPAQVILGDEAQRMARRIRSRYFTERGEEQVGTVMARYDDVVIAITPETWMAWDMSAFNEVLIEHGVPFDDADLWYQPVIGSG